MIAALFFTACNDTADTSAKTAPEPDSIAQDSEVDEMAAVQQAFPDLYRYLHTQDAAFTEDSFLLSGELVLDKEQVVPVDEASLKPFQPLLIYNSDSSYAVDLYSHNYIIVPRNGTERLEEGSPDAEAALIDTKAHTRKRIFYGGPSYLLWDAKWTSPTSFLLAGGETRSDGRIVPTIWQVRLQDTKADVYAYQGDIKADMSDYQSHKLAMGF